jgi:hypothetical protein
MAKPKCPNCRIPTLERNFNTIIIDDSAVPWAVYRCTRCGESVEIPLDIADSIDKKETQDD